MRVLMTTDTIGGVWTFTKELTTELLQSGCDVTLVSFGRPPSPSQRSWCETAAQSYGKFFRHEFSSIPLEWMDNNREAYSSGEPLLLHIAHEFGPDIFLSSQFCFGALPLDVPRIVVAHSDVLTWADACREGPLQPSEWLETYGSIVARGLANASAVIAPTQWMLSALAAHFRLPKNSYVIYNGRTLPTFLLDTIRKHQAITAGRLWDEAKNLKLLKNITSPLPILVAGEIKSHSATLAGDVGAATFIGPQSEDDLLTLFRESAIYLCTSIYEPFGLAPLEAAVCGCAVVANDIPSLREVWGDCALYFDSAPALSSLLARLTEGSDLLADAQQRSRARALSFTATRMAANYVTLFTRLLGSGESRAHAA